MREGFCKHEDKRVTKNAGFTLVEVLIALFIFSLISVGATSALTSSLRGKAQLDARLAEMSQIDSLRALVRADMASLVLRKRRGIYGNEEREALKSGGEALLSFTRSGRSNPGGIDPRGDLQRVDYIFEGQQLIRRSYARSNPAPQTPFTDRVLMDGLSAASLTALGYFSASGTQAAEIELPRFSFPPGGPTQITSAQGILNIGAVKLTLIMQNGDQLTQLFEIPL
jgi:general secretion pathway protein J